MTRTTAALVAAAVLGRGIEPAQVRAVGQTLPAGQDLVGAQPPEQVGAAGRGLPPQLEADEGAIGQAQHLRAQPRQQLRRQPDLAGIIAVQRHGEDRVRAAFRQAQQPQLREAAGPA